MSTRFLFNEALWEEVAARIPKAKRVRAAVAYLGTGGARLLPLRKGDQLVVDMSLRACGAGATDPRVVRTLLHKGVEVYSRASLHAKFFVFDDVVIAGSANISGRAESALDEAAILTDDRVAYSRARAVFDSLCTEPVRERGGRCPHAAAASGWTDQESSGHHLARNATVRGSSGVRCEHAVASGGCRFR